jgi:hypothetical protein
MRRDSYGIAAMHMFVVVFMVVHFVAVAEMPFFQVTAHE